ncbi:MAG: RNA polymerase sigma factor [Lewinellaceae bacterium]|nr:RNA polymerase sigma factor [Lewinellaceae bacterium]
MRPSELTPDPEGLALAEACRKGDGRAQRRLWELYKNGIFGICLRYSNTRPEAEDLLQEAFVRIFQHIGSYRGEGSLEGWMRKVAVRTAIYHVNKKQNKTEQLEPHQWDQVFQLQVKEEESGKMIRLLRQLPAGFRTVLNLYAIEAYSHEEIARELGISVGTSKSQLHRAKALLRKLMDKSLLLL